MGFPKNSFANQLVGAGFGVGGLAILGFGAYTIYELLMEISRVRIYPFILVGVLAVAIVAYSAALKSYKPSDDETS